MEVTCPELIKTFEELNELIQLMHEHSSINFLPLTKQIKTYYDGLKQLSSSTKTEEETAAKFEFLNKIITELQFHDIIRQKLEHIEHIHCELIRELLDKNKKEDLQNSRYIKILPHIVRLSMAQLELVNEEFNNAIQEITKNMKEIESSLKTASIEPAESFNQAHTFFFTSKKIIKNLKMLNFYLSQHNVEEPEGTPLDYIEQVYTMESEREVFYKIFNLSEKMLATKNEQEGDNDTIEFF